MRTTIKDAPATGMRTTSESRAALYDIMRIRMVEERIVELYPDQQMRCPVHLSIGQEAVAVGVCRALAAEDSVMSGHRAHAHYLAKGGSLDRMLAELYGKKTGCCGGRGGSMHLIDTSVNFLGSTPIVSGTIPVATGVAWAYKLQGEKRVATVFFGEGATEEGVWHESINFAQLHKLPVIYVCENNLYSVYTPLSQRQPKRSITDIASAHGLQTYSGDGNDVSHVYDCAQQARTWALEGKGPVFLEFQTYRWREHCGPNYDNDIGYRSVKEFETWKQHDPLKRAVQHAMDRGNIRHDDIAVMEKAISTEIDEAVAFAHQSSFPSYE